MSALFFYSFLVLSLIVLIKVVINPGLILQFPYFMGAIIFIFILPQTIIIYNQPQIVPKSSLTPLLCMCFLCLAACIAGYKFSPAIKLGKGFNVQVSDEKLRIVGIAYTFVGYLFLLLIQRELRRLGSDAPEIWTGILTIYFQFFQTINIAFPILLYMALKKPNWINILLAIFAALPLLYLIVFSGRREITAFFVLAIAFTVYFRHRIVPPRIAIIGAIFFATLFIPATGDYRAISKTKGPAEAFRSLDLQKSFVNYYNKGEFLELEVAANVIYTCAFDGDYGYGSSYWDWMVWRYVPAQILGEDFKMSLMISDEGIKFRNGFVPTPGLTFTGIGDSFMQFSYLGCLFFFFLGGLFRSLWTMASTSSNPLIQVFYLICVVQAMLSVTHGTMNFIPGIFFSFICLLAATAFSREKT